MTESGFVAAQSDNLPKIDVFMMTTYFANNCDFTSAELRGVKAARAPDTPRPRQAISAPSVPASLPKSPVKNIKEPTKERPRSNSVTSPVPALSRKRTSSGVFQVDESEPQPKKSELVRTTDAPRKRSDVNGKKDPREKEAKQKLDKKVIERFDEEAKAQCVSAFKESDSWD